MAVAGLMACTELQEQVGSVGALPVAPDSSSRAAYDQAEIAFAGGEYAKARELFSGVLAREPNNFAAAIGLGETLLALGNHQEAAAQFTRVADESLGGSQKARAQLGLGLVHLRKGELGTARTYLDQSVNSDPGLWRAWLALGQVYDRQKQFADARRAFARAQDAAPAEAVVLNDAGMSLLAEGKATEAIAYFQRAIAADPTLQEARNNIRLAHARGRNYSEAVEGARDEEMPAILNNVGYIAILNGDLDTAESFLQESIQTSPYHNTTAIANMNFLESVRRRTTG